MQHGGGTRIWLFESVSGGEVGLDGCPKESISISRREHSIMPSNGDPPISQDVYNALASGYNGITSAAIREHYEWPAVRSLLPDVAGLDVLDAACGDGFYTRQLVKDGATVVGVDASQEMVERARERFSDQNRASIYESDITDGVSQFGAEQFDLVVCQLALEHIEDWESVFAGFSRVLKPHGRVVISTSHPVRDYVDAEFPVRDQILADSATYAEVERVDRDWGDGTESFLVPFYRRPFEEVIRPAIDAELLVEDVVEPEVTDAFREARPDHAYTFYEGPPNFICLRFVKVTTSTYDA